MQSIIYAFLEALTYPPYLSLSLLLVGAALLLLRRRKLAIASLVLALGWSWLWSLPLASGLLRDTLAQRYAVIPTEQLPYADAIVVLGGASSGYWMKRDEVDADDLRHSRLAAGARAWLAGRAPLVVLSGGGGPKGPSEADRMAKAIARLGVPASAMLLEERSHSTRENAFYTAQLARQLGIRCVLLVTSSVHMPRASFLFSQTGLQVIEVPTPEPTWDRGWRRWIPDPGALRRTGGALKEYGALLEARAPYGIEWLWSPSARYRRTAASYNACGLPDDTSDLARAAGSAFTSP